jgi:hypothetical protein
MSKPFVIVDGERIPVEDVKFINIEEDFQGCDVLPFEYNGKEYKSRVYN